MSKILIICGPTATGKTKLAISLAKKFNGEIVSADSRQIYKGLDVLTGKDLPAEKKFQIADIKPQYKGKIYSLPVYIVNGVRIWMYDVIGIGEEFSAAHFSALSRVVISDIISRGKLPIVVGGTGFYLSALTQKITTIDIPPNTSLRQKLSSYSIEELQKKLKSLDPGKWLIMNDSDRANPRRLIRAIEVADWMKINPHKSKQSPEYQAFWIGLRASLPAIKNKITRRVNARLQNGAIEEVAALGGLSGNSLVLTSLGVAAIRRFLTGNLSKEALIKEWESQEFKYAKRQMTWFHKQLNIHWYDISHEGYVMDITKDVKAWYTKNI